MMVRLSAFISVLLCVAGSLVMWGGGEALVLRAEPVESPQVRLEKALRHLGSLPTGQMILEKARAQWAGEWLERFQWGTSSRTDAILTRHFDPKTGIESRERQVIIVLKENQPFEDLVLDLSHELTHATNRPSWDPYDPDLSPAKYIWAAIEGQGGEVDALSNECRITLEWERLSPKAPLKTLVRCKEYLARSGDIDPEKVKGAFYRVGKWKNWMLGRLGAEKDLFPVLSGEEPKLYSSTGAAPYPLALFREYEQLTKTACENTKKRMSVLEKESVSRAPAAFSLSRVSDFLASRCQSL